MVGRRKEKEKKRPGELTQSRLSASPLSVPSNRLNRDSHDSGSQLDGKRFPADPSVLCPELNRQGPKVQSEGEIVVFSSSFSPASVSPLRLNLHSGTIMVMAGWSIRYQSLITVRKQLGLNAYFAISPLLSLLNER